MEIKEMLETWKKFHEEKFGKPSEERRMDSENTKDLQKIIKEEVQETKQVAMTRFNRKKIDEVNDWLEDLLKEVRNQEKIPKHKKSESSNCENYRAAICLAQTTHQLFTSIRKYVAHKLEEQAEFHRDRQQKDKTPPVFGGFNYGHERYYNCAVLFLEVPKDDYMATKAKRSLTDNKDTASKAVDALMESHWSKGNDAFFKTRESIVDYLHIMLEHKFFHRARKVPVTDQELKGKKKEKKSIDTGDDKKDKGIDKEKKERGTDAESSVTEAKKEEVADKEKRKRKIRLDMHNDQRFVDGLDAYVWIYDPIPFYYWIIGTLLVLGAIGVCLFPLWPPTVRMGVYYLSVAAAGFLVFIILLAILRLIIFCLIWVVTFGKHHLWILPNLTEDVGFFASFWPLYTYEYKGGKGKNKDKKDKDSDAEDESEKKVEDDIKESKKSSKSVIEKERQHEQGGNTHVEEVQGASESESESSQRSSTGKDFEMVDQVDLDS
ncbi:hypothetical protein FQA39_LY08946 [Lamprigera yunnana]|nr:hypothetical protein FQA39_LY08946 [Lamprigera yunnana]